MLVRNGKPLDLDNPKSQVEKDVVKGIEELKKRSEFISIVNPSPFRYDDDNRAIQKPINAFHTKTTIVKDGMPEEWIYCKTPKHGKDGNYIYDPEFITCHDSIQIDPNKNAQAAYFLTSVMDVSRVGLMLEDKEKKNIELSEQRKLQMEVGFYIYGDKLSEAEVRTLALSWGIMKADVDPIDMVRNELLNRVEQGEKDIIQTQRGYKAFADEANSMGEEVMLRALVNKAVEKEVIEYNSQRMRWVYKGSDHVIASVPPMKIDIKEAVLVQKMREDEALKETFMDTMEGNAGQLATFDPKNYKMLNKTDLIKTAKQKHGIVLTEKMTKAQMLKELEEKLG